jgi:hypothetical protein
MTIINASFIAWVKFLGGESTIHYTLSILFLFVLVYVLLRITT